MNASKRPEADAIVNLVGVPDPAALATAYGNDPVKVAAALIRDYGLSAKTAKRAAETACSVSEAEADEAPEPLPEVPRIPVEKLVGPLRAFVEWGIRDGLYPECTTCAGLSALATVAGPARLKTGAKLVKPILWLPLIGKASSGKTPAYEQAYARIRELYAAKRAEWEENLKTWKAQVNAEGKKAAGDRPTPPQPYELDDATIEAVARWLHARGEDTSGAIVDDELAAFLEGLNQYKGGQGADLSKWLKMWAGVPLHIQRVGAGGEVNGIDLYISDPVVSVSGPLVMKNLHLLGKPDSGFRPRWLPFFAPPEPPAWNHAGEHPGAWTGCIDAMNEHRELREWTLDGAALIEWEKARKRWHVQQSGPEPDDVIEALRKADQQALRIALVIAESLNPGRGGPVPLKAVKCAVAIMDYCIKVWRALPGNSTMITSRREEVMDSAYRRMLDWLESRPESNAGLPEGSKPRPGASKRDLSRWLHEPPQKINELIAEHRARWPGSVISVKGTRGPETVWLYAPPRADTQSPPKLSRRQFPDEYEHASDGGETPGQDASELPTETVAGTVADAARQFHATVSGGAAGGLRNVTCPSCGTTERTAVEAGETAYCKQCDSEYTAA